MQDECDFNTIKPNAKDCLSAMQPIQDALYVLGGKWKIPIIVAITEGNKRFGEILKSVDKIAPKVLSHELKELQLNGFLERKTQDINSSVLIEYELTEYSNSLGPVLIALRDWGMTHRNMIKNGLI